MPAFCTRHRPMLDDAVTAPQARAFRLPHSRMPGARFRNRTTKAEGTSRGGVCPGGAAAAEAGLPGDSGNACPIDTAFVATRFRRVMWRRLVVATV